MREQLSANGWQLGTLNEPGLGGDRMTREKAEDRAEGRPSRGWLIHGRGYIMLWMADNNFVVWKFTGEGGSRKLWWMFG